MSDNHSFATEKFRRELHDCVEKNKDFVTQSKVQIGHSIDVKERSQPAELNSLQSLEKLNIGFLWEDRDIGRLSILSNHKSY